jgi:hypothetical protein
MSSRHSFIVSRYIPGVPLSICCKCLHSPETNAEYDHRTKFIWYLISLLRNRTSDLYLSVLERAHLSGCRKSGFVFPRLYIVLFWCSMIWCDGDCCWFFIFVNILAMTVWKKSRHERVNIKRCTFLFFILFYFFYLKVFDLFLLVCL